MTYKKPALLSLGSALTLIENVNGDKYLQPTDGQVAGFNCYTHELDE